MALEYIGLTLILCVCVCVQNGEHLCTMSQSPHQLMYNLYNIIALTEVKGYAMVQFSYMMLRIYNKVTIQLLLLYNVCILYNLYCVVRVHIVRFWTVLVRGHLGVCS